ncbi:MAG: hypothetical protein AB200_00510 [Parcubacteria bacterium C7867-005]|nr:MAG: hypothetical protein AB200_00510 [Parcubacteria bacterium C7867-005]
MNIFEELRMLDLPKGEYVVIGSGIMGALGIRKVTDLDFIVTPQVFDRLRSEGWEYCEIEIEGRIRQKLVKGSMEAFKDFWYNGEDRDTVQMIRDAEMIEDYPFMSLDDLLKFKKSLDRPKDHEDIKLIEEYLSNNK